MRSTRAAKDTLGAATSSASPNLSSYLSSIEPRASYAPPSASSSRPVLGGSFASLAMRSARSFGSSSNRSAPSSRLRSAAMSSSMSSLARAEANDSVAGDAASALYSWSSFTALAMDACMRSAKFRARSRYAVLGVPSVLGGIGTCTGVPCAEPGRDRPPTPSPKSDPAPSEVGDAPRRADDPDITSRPPRCDRRIAHLWRHLRKRRRPTNNDFEVCLHSSPVNVGRSAPTRNRNVDRRCVRVFGFNFSKGQNRPLFPNRRVMTPRRSRNGAPATRSPRGRNEARASFGVPSWTLFEAPALFEVCQYAMSV